MHDYNTILGVIELRLSKVSYDAVQKRYRIGRSGITLIMNRYNDSGLSLDDLKQMPASKVVDLIYPKDNLRHKEIPLPDFEKIHEQMIQMGKHADLSFLWIDYKNLLFLLNPSLYRQFLNPDRKSPAFVPLKPANSARTVRLF